MITKVRRPSQEKKEIRSLKILSFQDENVFFEADDMLYERIFLQSTLLSVYLLLLLLLLFA